MNRRNFISQKKVRNSSIEFLRILAMIMIVASHFSVHTNWGQIDNQNIQYVIDLLGCFGKVGVGIFFIISGYFMAQSKNINFDRNFPIIKTTWFYSILFFLIFLLFAPRFIDNLSIPLEPSFLRSILPITTSGYWFVSAFIAVNLLYPYMRKWFDSLDNASLLSCFLIVSAILFIPSIITIAFSSYQQLIFNFPAAFYYSFAGYVVYRFYTRLSVRKSAYILFASAIFTLLIPILIRYLNNVGYNLSTSMLTSTESLPCFLISTSLFIIFSKNSFCSKIVNYISSLTFGVYLIHDNFLIRRWLWQGEGILKVSRHACGSTFNFIIYSLMIIACVFIICCVIESVRKQLLSVICKLCSFFRRDRV